MVLAAIWLALPKPPLLEGIDFSQRVRDRNGNVLRVTLTADQNLAGVDRGDIALRRQVLRQTSGR
jgi:membrane carboxypeptidase/penicillin-binding protein PbpC